MTECPDSNRLADFVTLNSVDPDVEAHLRGCRDCQALVRIMKELPEAFQGSDVEVPEHLVQRVLRTVPEAAPSRPGVVAYAHLAASVALGMITVAGALVVTGAAGVGGPLDFVGFSLVAGLVVGLRNAPDLKQTTA